MVKELWGEEFREQRANKEDNWAGEHARKSYTPNLLLQSFPFFGVLFLACLDVVDKGSGDWTGLSCGLRVKVGGELGEKKATSPTPLVLLLKQCA